MNHELKELYPGMALLYGGNRLATVSADLARRFRAGDRVLIVQRTGELLHVPEESWKIATGAVGRACDAFSGLVRAGDDQLVGFFDRFALALEESSTWDAIARANEIDVAGARARGRSITRLVVSDGMRRAMVSGLREWRDGPSVRGRVVETIDHPGWRVERVRAGYGVVGFVFEGRPNVFADAAGVLRGGNTVVLRIGSDALGTARAIVRHALQPSLAAAGLPEDSMVLVESPEHSAGWALFSDSRLGLAVARGSGRAVALLGSLAAQAGTPVSLHGTGGAWIVADGTADPARLEAVVYHSTDRKVCNTVNVVCLPRSRDRELAGAVLAALERRGRVLGYGFRLHVAAGSETLVPAELFERTIAVMRADGPSREPVADAWPSDRLGHEWEWEKTPEITLLRVETADEAVDLFNRQSPRFAASLVSDDPGAHARFFEAVDAPFVGDGFTRWVDGQYALNRPELGLSNWEFGRLFGRSGILSGDGVFTERFRAAQSDPNLHR